jgi:hypothetical protein
MWFYTVARPFGVFMTSQQKVPRGVDLGSQRFRATPVGMNGGNQATMRGPNRLRACIRRYA